MTWARIDAYNKIRIIAFSEAGWPAAKIRKKVRKTDGEMHGLQKTEPEKHPEPRDSMHSLRHESWSSSLVPSKLQRNVETVGSMGWTCGNCRKIHGIRGSHLKGLKRLILITFI